MEFLKIYDPSSLTDSAVSFTVAFLLGMAIDYERQVSQSNAGLRTNVLVALGAAIFVDIANRYHGIYGGNYGAVHVIAYVVSGVGFLGAGLIMREGGNIKGLNTAATLWATAAVGAAAGADLIFEAILGTSFILLANTLLRQHANSMLKRSVESSTNGHVIIEVDSDRKQYGKVLKFFQNALNGYDYIPQSIQIKNASDEMVQIVAEFASRPEDNEALDKLVEIMRAHGLVSEARWSSASASQG